jgi:citronellol/citronellal dehydrogenase
VIDTAALAMIPGVDRKKCRKPEILADAARIIFDRDARTHTGHFHIDEDVLAADGIADLAEYSVVPGNKSSYRICFSIDGTMSS